MKTSNYYIIILEEAKSGSKLIYYNTLIYCIFSSQTFLADPHIRLWEAEIEDRKHLVSEDDLP